ncbi:hypothetical protein ACJJTC_017313 [Scirpophaga incertulas]
MTVFNLNKNKISCENVTAQRTQSTQQTQIILRSPYPVVGEHKSAGQGGHYLRGWTTPFALVASHGITPTFPHTYTVVLTTTRDAVLRPPLALEIVGGRQDPRSDDGPRRGRLHGDREKDQEETYPGLSVGEPALPQLVGVPVLPLRGACLCQRHR